MYIKKNIYQEPMITMTLQKLQCERQTVKGVRTQKIGLKSIYLKI